METEKEKAEYLRRWAVELAARVDNTYDTKIVQTATLFEKYVKTGEWSV